MAAVALAIARPRWRAPRAENEREWPFVALSTNSIGCVRPNERLLAVAIVNFAAKNSLPAMYEFRDFVHAGGMMAYGPEMAAMFRRAATYVDKILKGAKPGDPRDAPELGEGRR